MSRGPGCEILSLERVIRIIEGLGLKRTEAEVYVYLAKKGPLSAEEVVAIFNLSKQKLYRILKKLQNIGVVNTEPKNPAIFKALVFEKALDLLIRANIEQARAIEEIREELLSNWHDNNENDNT